MSGRLPQIAGSNPAVPKSYQQQKSYPKREKEDLPSLILKHKSLSLNGLTVSKVFLSRFLPCCLRHFFLAGNSIGQSVALLKRRLRVRVPPCQFDLGLRNKDCGFRNPKSKIENRYRSVAKSGLRQRTFNPLIVGSNPTRSINFGECWMGIHWLQLVRLQSSSLQ